MLFGMVQLLLVVAWCGRDMFSPETPVNLITVGYIAIVGDAVG